MAIETVAQLRALSEEQLIHEHDKIAKDFNPKSDHYLSELFRRGQDRQTQTMLRYTFWITLMTGAMTLATIINFIVLFNSGATGG